MSQPTYLPSASTGVFGSYTISNLTDDTAVTTAITTTTAVEYTYYPSISSGIFGSYTITPFAIPEPIPTIDIFEYRASNSTGIFGSYTILSTVPVSQIEDQKEQIPPYLETSAKWKPGPHFSQSKQNNNNNNNENNENNSENNTNTIPSSYGVKIIGEWSFKTNKTAKFYVCNGSVVAFSGECIVNAANEGCLGGGGVDGAITSAGGYRLDELRRSLPVIPNTYSKRCMTGDAVITGSGYGEGNNRLRCKYVLHAVGPNYMVRMRGAGSMEECDKLLYNSYKRCLELGRQHGIKTIGFCLISAGIFRGPQSLDRVLEIGCKAIYDNIYDGCEEIYMIGYRNDEMDTLLNVTPKVFGKPNVIYGNKRSQASGFSFDTAKGFAGKLLSKVSFRSKK